MTVKVNNNLKWAGLGIGLLLMGVLLSRFDGEFFKWYYAVFLGVIGLLGLILAVCTVGEMATNEAAKQKQADMREREALDKLATAESRATYDAAYAVRRAQLEEKLKAALAEPAALGEVQKLDNAIYSLNRGAPDKETWDYISYLTPGDTAQR